MNISDFILIFLIFRIFYAMEYVGEIVCTMMVLTESKYQYVIDSMDENDWRRARENEKRRNNDAIIQDAA